MKKQHFCLLLALFLIIFAVNISADENNKLPPYDNKTNETPILTGNLLVTSAPSKANVYVDGNLLKDLTPLIIKGVNVGKHVVNILKDGYKDFITTVTINSGKISKIHANLQKLRCVDTDKGKNIYVTGKTYKGEDTHYDGCFNDTTLVEYYCQNKEYCWASL